MENFKLSEFSNRPMPEAIRQNIEKLVRHLLDPLRNALGYPVQITSGYRNAEHNRRVGGVFNSDHLRGCAADFILPGHPAPAEAVLRVIRANRLPYDQLILYKTFMHLSYREEANRGMIIDKRV